MKAKSLFFLLFISLASAAWGVVPGGGIRELVVQPNSRNMNENKRVTDLLENTRVYTIGGGIPDNDSIRHMIMVFYEDQYRHAQDPLAPYFMFMSKDAKIAMGMGGVVKMRGWVDWHNAINSSDFSPYLIEIPLNPAHRHLIGGSPAGTTIYFTIFGRKTSLGNWQGYIEANFDGYQSVGFKLKKAYFSWDDWTAGYTTSTFSDPAAEPPTIDGAGANGVMGKTNLLVRYLTTFKGKWTVGGSIEMPKATYKVDGVNVEKTYDFIPDLVATAQYQWDGGVSHVRFAGLLRALSYRNLVTKTNHTLAGWGLQISSTLKVANPIALYGILTYGRGHGSYAGDLSKDDIDLMPFPGENGRMYAPKAFSAIFGARYSLRHNVSCGIALSELRHFLEPGADPTAYKYGLYGAVNVFWNIMPRLKVGVEYLAAKRMDFGGAYSSSNRVDAMFQLSF